MQKKKAKGKKVSGDNYVASNEKFQRQQAKKLLRDMSTSGVANEMKEAMLQQGYSKMPRVKPQKKLAKPVSGQKKIYN